MKSRLHKKFEEEVVSKFQKKFDIKNKLAIPHLEKIVINMGVGKAIADMKALDSAVKDLETIAGQKPIIRRAKIAVSNFKLRKGMPIGCKVTLRREKMFEFFDRLVCIALPRIRDFNGVSRKSFDRQGNYSLGLIEQVIFPEIDAGKISYTQGMDICFVFNRGPKEYTEELLTLLGMPFAKKREES